MMDSNSRICFDTLKLYSSYESIAVWSSQEADNPPVPTVISLTSE